LKSRVVDTAVAPRLSALPIIIFARHFVSSNPAALRQR